ncbi:MAG: hypothetical protein ACN6OP_24150 [Pseudomonadales bacterium]
MKIITRCNQCDPQDEAALIEIGNENLHQVLCDKGHKFHLVLAQQKHEILFEVATHAIVDGYYREAISSFAASLERYYEFFIKVIAIDWPAGQFASAWKHVTSQSERQLGGYIFVYNNVFRTSPEILSPKLTQLRNSVVHKGIIPSRSEAVTFGKEVAKLINDGCNLLRRKNLNKVEEIIRQTICPEDKSYEIKVLSTYLNCLIDCRPIEFEEYIKSVQTHNTPRFE